MKWLLDNFEVIIDLEDYNRALRFSSKWHIYIKGNSPVCVCNKGNRVIPLSKFIMKVWKRKHKYLQVDHINLNTLDNQRNNLRLALAAENIRNRGLFKNNTSGDKNVCWHKRSK